MNRNITLAVGIAIIMANCHPQKNAQKSTITIESTDTRGNLMLLGKATKERLEQEPFAGWFNKNYNDYRIDSSTADLLKPAVASKRFLIFMGTWCGDSRMEVPRIYKLLDYCGVQASQIELITVNVHDSVYKQSPTHEEKGLNIHRVPDLLVYEHDLEIGRVIETPVQSWEKDLLAIVQHAAYTPRYSIVAYLENLFKSRDEKDIDAGLTRIADSLRSKIGKNEGLLSYGNVLLATNQTQKALMVHRLNTMLYPTAGSGFIALADTYLKTGDRQQARLHYEKALALLPGNEKATLMLAQLMK